MRWTRYAARAAVISMIGGSVDARPEAGEDDGDSWDITNLTVQGMRTRRP
jgi:hypothetical protein